MALQRVLEKMQGYKYIQYIQLNYLLNKISIKLWALIVKSYSYILILILYSYTFILSLENL